MDNTKTLQGKCESCMMPFKKDPKGINREHEKYCSYCYTNGKLCYEGNDVKEFKKAMINAIVARGESRLKANFLPLWQDLPHGGKRINRKQATRPLL